MRIEWVNKKGSGRIVLFFNGWGMNADVVSHLTAGCDVVMMCDYTSLKCTGFPDLSTYDEIYVIAWSMGVWAAANVLSEWDIHPVERIALNGTERPVDDNFGIPETVYRLTENGMDERGREKFFSRMLADKEERLRFSVVKPAGDLPKQVEELKMIRKQSYEHKKCLKWDRVFISEGDVIFPPGNQLNWWKNNTLVHFLPSGHYPFYCFRSWDEILENKKNLQDD